MDVKVLNRIKAEAFQNSQAMDHLFSRGDDTGTGRFRGISVGGNDMAKPIFEAWLAPLRDLEATTVV